ncbi:MAG: hypothetical protein I8H71_01455 [Xanthomonadaceae bacterium]|nr:hypothetical protein [Xanthomonadaceae bacterium]
MPDTPAPADDITLPAPLEIDWPELNSHALGCGVEDRGLRDRYAAAEYGWQDGVDRAAECVPEDIYTSDMVRQIVADDRASTSRAAVVAPVVQVDDDYADLRMALANDPQRWHCDANMTPFYNDADGYSRGGDYAGTYCVFGDAIVIEGEDGDEEHHDGVVLIEMCGKNDAMYIEACAPDTIRALLAEVDLRRASTSTAAVDVGAAQAETAQAAPTDDTTSREQYRRMFIAACEALGLVNEALGLDPDDGGAEPILAAIRDLKAAQAAPVVPAGYALIRSENGFSLRSPGGEQWLFQPSIGTGTSSHFVYEFLAAIAGTPGATHGN